MYLLGTGTQASIGRLGKFEPFNRAMTAAELASHFKSGVDSKDRIAPNLAVAISNPTFNVDGTGWFDNSGGSINARVSGGEVSIASTGVQQIGTAPGTIPSNGWLFIRIKMRSTGSNVIPQLRLSQNDYFTSNIIIVELSSRSIPTSTTYEFYVPNTSGTRNRFWIREQNGVGGTLIVDSVQIWSVGQTASLQPAGIQLAPGQWIDQSTNAKHVIIPDGARLASPAQNGIIRRTVTWTAESIGKDILGGALAALPVNSVIEEVYLDFTSGTPVDGNLGDGSNVSRFCNSAHNTGLVSGMNQLAIDEGKNNGTNRRLIWTPVGVFTGTIKFLTKIGVIE